MSCKKEYDRRAKDLPILQPGTKVFVYDNGPGPSKGFTHPGEILSVRDPDNKRLYIVRMDSTGKEMSRNRARLQPVTDEPDPLAQPMESETMTEDQAGSEVVAPILRRSTRL